MIFLTRDDIDDVRWDGVINKSGQGLPYAYSWSLDQVAGKQWDAIISEDYTWVLPLPYNRKICGFKQYYTPYLIQQLGVIGDVESSESFLLLLNKMISKHCIRAKLAFNEMNGYAPQIFHQDKTNFVLKLNGPYDKLRSNYKKNLQQVLKKKDEFNISLGEDSSITTFLKYYFEYTFSKFSASEKLSPNYIQDYLSLLNSKGLVNILLSKNDLDEIFAGLLYLKTEKRIIILLQFANPEFKKLSGPSLLIDEVIKRYSNSEILLDFEGSDIPGIAMFYNAFSPERRSFGILKIR